MGEWLKLLAGCLCIITILLNILPKGSYTSYVNFYAGMLFFLMAVKPVINLLAGDGELERLLKLEILKEEYYDAETSVQGIAELKNEQILSAYQSELNRQLEEIGAACGARVESAKLYFEEEDPYVPRLAVLEISGTQMQSISEIRREIEQVFGLTEKQIRVSNQGDGSN